MNDSDKIVAYLPNTVCLRCGVTRMELMGQKNLGSCSAWGKCYERHLWNRETVEIRTHIISMFKKPSK